jgi:hypothetical protein
VIIFKIVVFWVEASHGFVIGYQYFRKNMLPPSSGLKHVDVGLSLVMQAGYKGGDHVTQAEGVKKVTWPVPTEFPPFLVQISFCEKDLR